MIMSLKRPYLYAFTGVVIGSLLIFAIMSFGRRLDTVSDAGIITNPVSDNSNAGAVTQPSTDNSSLPHVTITHTQTSPPGIESTSNPPIQESLNVVSDSATGPFYGSGHSFATSSTSGGSGGNDGVPAEGIFVIPESPIGVFALIGSSLAVFAGYAYFSQAGRKTSF